ncbi:hypothetical protein CCACVL1_02068 [Corchorus capsularis]|uniref:Uncharacterized protein n=1 Tax=Corchorus capsularis TaxID=210143 RepID=A0A1R3KD51_COCAP|nr:hypothetical protein CCACVL1_02068 [Corchorus capsularis]
MSNAISREEFNEEESTKSLIRMS